MTFLTQTALVLMAGIYAIRASYPLLGHEAFSPLTLVAAMVFLLAVALFHRLRKITGKLLYVVVALCLVGILVNGMLLFAPDGPHASLINTAFSATCVVGWAIVAIAAASKIYRPSPKLQ
jgi:hypothetical protein